MGSFILDRFNGQEVYSFEKGTITASHNGSKFTQWVYCNCAVEINYVGGLCYGNIKV